MPSSAISGPPGKAVASESSQSPAQLSTPSLSLSISPGPKAPSQLSSIPLQVSTAPGLTDALPSWQSPWAGV